MKWNIYHNNNIENDNLNEEISKISNKILENTVEEGLQELKSFLRNNIKNMYLEIIGQFHWFLDNQNGVSTVLTCFETAKFLYYSLNVLVTTEFRQASRANASEGEDHSFFRIVNSNME
ncbi:hypothetical protein H8356DRAFT_1359608 [Neocallimastix lanati (nom. inval.)]|nr:hypothetical protein H8356DRAFT_1359608 [Neocallimastix sp. JGI-2020a]